jgi:hypothetical protein
VNGSKKIRITYVLDKKYVAQSGNNGDKAENHLAF